MEMGRKIKGFELSGILGAKLISFGWYMGRSFAFCGIRVGLSIFVLFEILA